MSGAGERLGKHITECLSKGDANLTVGRAVKFQGGYMHPEAYRDFAGEDAYQELLALPRVVCEYDYEEE